MSRPGDGTSRRIRLDGPFFEDLSVGQVFGSAPPVTLTDGRAAVHQSIAGDRLRLPLDGVLATRVAGAPLAHPALVWDTAIGQLTTATRNVRANLFYRDLVFRRMPVIGDTLTTTTTVEGLRENTRRPGRAPTGLVALRMQTVDQDGASVLDFYRCAMIPLRDRADTGKRDDLGSIGRGDSASLAAVSRWDLSAVPATRLPDAGECIEIAGGDVVSSAPELARLTLNVAAVHHDRSAAGGTRLVYGGHTIALALAQASRAIEGLVTVLGWQSCDHLAPVHEGDTLHSSVEIVANGSADGLAGARLLELHSIVTADGATEAGVPVLDWRYVALAK